MRDQKRCYVELAAAELRKSILLDQNVVQMAKDLQRKEEIWDGLVCQNVFER